MTGLDQAQLDRALDHCRSVTRRRARNFYYGLRLLPREKRHALYAIYAWNRRADDIVDAGSSNPAQVRARLDVFRRRTDEALAGRSSSNGQRDGEDELLLLALEDTARRFTIEPKLLHEMIEGQLSDLDRRRFETMDELLHYCHLVASTVGLVCIEIWGYDDPEARKLAVDRGVAFQLTNILRDYREDYDADRVYIPRELLDKHGITAAELYQWSRPKPCAQLVGELIDTARARYERSAGLDALISADCRPTLRAMTDIYRGLLDQIESNPQRIVGSRRIRLSSMTKFAIVGRALLSSRTGRETAASTAS